MDKKKLLLFVGIIVVHVFILKTIQKKNSFFVMIISLNDCLLHFMNELQSKTKIIFHNIIFSCLISPAKDNHIFLVHYILANFNHSNTFYFLVGNIVSLFIVERNAIRSWFFASRRNVLYILVNFIASNRRQSSKLYRW